MSTTAFLILFIVMILPGILLVVVAAHLKVQQINRHQASQPAQLPGMPGTFPAGMAPSPMQPSGDPSGQTPDSYASRDFSHSFGYYSEVDELILQNRIPQAVRSFRKHARVRLPEAQQAVEQRAHELRGHWN